MATDGNTSVVATEPQPLIAGKYKTIEEAERAIKEGERKMHEATQAAARERQRADTAEANLRARSQNSPASNPQSDLLAQRLLTEPEKVLEEFGQNVIGAAAKLTDARIGTYVETALVVNDFLRENPVAKKHAKLFRALYAERTEDDVSDKLAGALRELQDELRPATERGRKEAAAERKARGQANIGAGAEDEGEHQGAPSGTPEGDKTPEQTFDDYMDSRTKDYAKIKAASV